MKRSSQIALVLMGATAVGGTSYAMMPRNECRPVPGAQQPAGASVRINPATGQPEPCREDRRSSSSSRYSSWGSSGSSSTWSRRSQQPTSTSVAMRPSGTSVPSTSSHSSTSVASRGGFGSTGHGVSSGG
jgi:hypothetical protein